MPAFFFFVAHGMVCDCVTLLDFNTLPSFESETKPKIYFLTKLALATGSKITLHQQRKSSHVQELADQQKGEAAQRGQMVI